MTFVYFIANDTRTLVKIGTSDDPRARFNSLRCDSPDALHMLTVIPGDERYERALHRRFYKLRAHGEWFHLRNDLAELLELLPSVDQDAKPTAVRARVKPQLTALQKKRVSDQYKAYLAECRRMVDAIGIGDFADAVGSDRSDIVKALNGSGRYFRYDHCLALRELCADLEPQLLEQILTGGKR